MEKFNRAVRRHHIERLKKHRKYYWFGKRPAALMLMYAGENHLCVKGFDRLSPKQLGKVVQNPHPCSCMGCSNERSTEGPTIQERSHLQLFKAEYEKPSKPKPSRNTGSTDESA